ncbi:transcription factor TFIIIC subunit TFC6 [Aspergillus clavatus NRRL 1]|uniref:Transcription factor TFIIIC complex subunit Tfc6, putative n=1 Tax=Aspergillus clavatus (strain ATCC 1007 / CBS 513.65 / DSM 816 / NCTC 3887 / NRRL 1 / QM 1276 / 107) TaxID=344612 RepID=A1CKE3_ASPCL|nr:transcription factor TFIIIC complex subunit Tfc6, putative [Aspergillus clavatus NRRL 1]EAW09617.1 transcription factor TFIIIC complex subunit Tfc6, putative [Aspergillus clavatus NRRL 1]
MPRARRSTRLSGATTKYTSDPFEVAGVSDDFDFAEGPSVPGRREKQPISPEISSDEEYKEAQNDATEGRGAEDEDDDEDGDVEMVLEEPDDEDELNDDDTDAVKPKKAKKAKAPARASSKAKPPRSRPEDRTVAIAEDETHFRGTWNPIEHMGKTIHMKVTFGTDERDLLSMAYTRDRFARGVDAAFPTRASLDEAQTLPDYKYGPTFGAEPEDVKKESTRGWDWYYADDIGGRARKRQRIEPIGEEEARSRYMMRQEKKLTVFIGPVDEQKKFELRQNEAADFGEAWRDKGKKSDFEPKTATREGWLLNMGQKIQGMAWVPNQPGLTQYLAIVAPISDEQKEDYPDPMKHQAGLAFRPSPLYPCALQIWAFKAKRDDVLTKTLDMKFKPRLRLALCTDWGDLRRIAWCPMPRAPRDEDDEDPLKHLGLLAGVWGDGYVRVIDVKLSRDPSATEFKRVHSPVFEAKPPSTVCTCVAWLSPTDIAVGCANGFVAIWSIIPSPESPTSPMPYFYEPLHRTYVLNLTSAYPTHPHLICTTAMDGETRMSSIIDYQKDTVETNRMRMGSPHVSYSPWLHSFLSSDENDFVRLLAVRRFYTTSAVARLSSTASALAPCSSWHPSILLGCAGGAVIATNPIRRLLHIKEKQWQQTWFTHEWVRGKEADSAGGVSRFIDGYRAESIMLSRNMVGDRKMVNGIMMLTIFDEGTHVTALAWNPNQPCAGWASAALGSGLLRVEDLAI